MKKLGFVLIMVLTAFFLMGCPNPVKEVEELPTEEEVLEMYKDWYISKSNEQVNLRSGDALRGNNEETVDDFMEVLSKFSVNVNNCHLKYTKGNDSLELWLTETLVGSYLCNGENYDCLFEIINGQVIGKIGDFQTEISSILEEIDYYN